MAGHSKWANIKRRKGAQDAKKGKIFSKASKAITIAARNGGGDPAANLTLKYAVDKARAANMPNSNIEQAIKKGTGELEGLTYEELMYEGFGPGGLAVMVEAVSDKRTRTTPEIKKLFDSRGGNLGGQGSVAFGFDQRGLIDLEAPGAEEEEVLDVILEAGGEDLEAGEDGHWTVTTGPKELHAVRTTLESHEGWTVHAGELAWLPQNTVSPSTKELEQAYKLIDALDEHEDVQNVFTNLDPEIAPPE
jgi:YebC/PmpR family DNA-binding regulatory protein